jgi:hypothetical protein
MAEKVKETETALNADVLIIGGGFRGLVAAIRIKELSPDASVMLVDKHFSTNERRVPTEPECDPQCASLATFLRACPRFGKYMTRQKYLRSQDSCPIFIDCGKPLRIRQSTGNAPWQEMPGKAIQGGS